MIEFAKVLPELFVGTCPSSEIDIKQIRLMGVTGILNVQTDDDFVKWEIDFPRLQQTSYDLDLVIQRVPIIDFDDKDLTKHLPSAVSLLNRMVAVGHTIYLHCTAGRDRSPTIAVAYITKHRDMSLEQAGSHIKSLRECRPKIDLIEKFIDDNQSS